MPYNLLIFYKSVLEVDLRHHMFSEMYICRTFYINIKVVKFDLERKVLFLDLLQEREIYFLGLYKFKY